MTTFPRSLDTFWRCVVVVPILVLAACSSSFLTTEEKAALTPAARVFQLQSEFNILLQQVNVYSSQQFCTDVIVVACADRGVVIEADRIATEANGAVRGAQAAVMAGAGNSAALASGARVAVAQLARYLILRGVQ